MVVISPKLKNKEINICEANPEGDSFISVAFHQGVPKYILPNRVACPTWNMWQVNLRMENDSKNISRVVYELNRFL